MGSVQMKLYARTKDHVYLLETQCSAVVIPITPEHFAVSASQEPMTMVASV